MKRVIVAGLLLVVVGCRPKTSPEVIGQWQSKQLYTCCNIHYEHSEISDANYYVGLPLPLGTRITVDQVTPEAFTFTADGGMKLTLYHKYGRAQESSEQYFRKVFVETDPRTQLATFPLDVQEAINDSRVEKGMTREQVIMSLGYPATHRTLSTDSNTWTYWHNRWVTYTVGFDSSGRVASIAGQAPTRGLDLSQTAPAAKPAAPAKAAPRK